MAPSATLLTVVVTVVDGGRALDRCLGALLAQDDAPDMEILIPFDDTRPDVPTIVDGLARGRDDVRPLDLGRLPTRHDPSSPAGQHELIDRRRAKGLAAARGEIVAIVEDRGVPRRDWASAIVRHHGNLPNLVIGGAVENGRDATLNWAVYLCDFGRYQLPFAQGPRPMVSDVNVAYKRRALELTREIWRERFHEPWVHRALERRGEILLASPDIVVDQVRDDLGLGELVRERMAWGRLFGALRASGATPARRLLRVAASPLVPAVMFARILRDRLGKPPGPGRFLAIAPATVLLLAAWAAGEAAGAIQAEP
jgi:hypothetical protein